MTLVGFLIGFAGVSAIGSIVIFLGPRLEKWDRDRHADD